MRIIIGADLVPTDSNIQHFRNCNAEYLFGDNLCDLLRNADYRIFNLEVPLTDIEVPIDKCGPNLIASTDTVGLFKEIDVNLFTLANNHIMDQGVQGLRSTISVLNNSGINYIGAGNNYKESAKPFFRIIGDTKVGFFSCVEHEFSYATYDTPGANPFDAFLSFDEIRNIKNQCDYLIVLYHGGKELYRYPTPDLQKRCRKFIDCGADLVVCQHSHCVGCEEKYNCGTIVYGQGNFLFDRSNIEEWKTGLLLVIENGQVNYVPLVKREDKVRIADKESWNHIMNGFHERSANILLPGYIDDKFQNFANSLIDQYLWVLSGASKSIFFRTINRLSKYKFYKKYVRYKYTKKERLYLLNVIECEAHNEVVTTALRPIWRKTI